MKVTKAEVIWLVLTIIFYVLYNLPGVPAYYDQVGAMVHAIVTVGPLWVVVFVGTKIVYKKYELRKEGGNQ